MTDTAAEVDRSRLVRAARRLGAACAEGWRESYARAAFLRVAGELTALDWPDQIRMVGCAGLSALATGAALSGLAAESRPWSFRAAWLVFGAAAVLCALGPRVAARLLMGRAAGLKRRV